MLSVYSIKGTNPEGGIQTGGFHHFNQVEVGLGALWELYALH